MAKWVREEVECKVLGIVVQVECAEGSSYVHVSWRVPEEMISGDQLVLRGPEVRQRMAGLLVAVDSAVKIIVFEALVLSLLRPGFSAEFCDVLNGVRRSPWTTEHGDPYVITRRAMIRLEKQGLIEAFVGVDKTMYRRTVNEDHEDS